MPTRRRAHIHCSTRSCRYSGLIRSSMRLTPVQSSSLMSINNLRVNATAEESADACSAFVLEYLGRALQSKPFVTFAISGGSTPKLLFRRLASHGFDWTKVH